MGLKFRYNNTTYSLVQLPPTPYYQEYINAAPALLCHQEYAGRGDAIYKTPASEKQSEKVFLLTDSSSHQRVYMNTTSPTVHFRKDSKTYHCAKSFTYIDRKSVSYSSNGGSGSMDSQTFYPDDGESVAIKANAFSRSGYSFVNWNTSPNGSGTSYSPGAKYSGSATINLYAQWKINFSATNWAYAYASSNTWTKSYPGNNKVFNHTEHFYNFTVKVTAPLNNVYDFTIVSKTGNWGAELVSNPDIVMTGSTTKTLSVQVRFRTTYSSGDPTAHLTIGLRNRTNNVNTIVSQYSFVQALSFGTTDTEE